MNSPDFSSQSIFRGRDRSAWQIMLLLMVISASAWMNWHMHQVMNNGGKSDAESRGIAPADESSAAVPRPHPRPFIAYDSSSDTMPDDARELFHEASLILHRIFDSGVVVVPADCVRHPLLTMPRIRSMKSRQRAAPVLPLVIGPRFGVKGSLLLTTLRLLDGTDRAAVLVKTPDGFQLDWEGFTGWCEVGFGYLRAGTGYQGRSWIMRVRCRQMSIRAPFADEKGASLLISHPAEDAPLHAFVPEEVLKRSKASPELMKSQDDAFTLGIAADGGTSKHGWVRVNEIICSGWVADR